MNFFTPWLDIRHLAPGHGRSVTNKFHRKVVYRS